MEVAAPPIDADAYGDDGFEADEVVPVTDATAAADAAADAAAVEEGENSHTTAALGSPVLRTRRQSADEQRNMQQLMFAKRLASGQACVSAQADLMSKGLFGAQLAARQVGSAGSANGDDENNTNNANANANANASRSARGVSGNGGTSSTRRRDVLHSLARPKRRVGGGAGGATGGAATKDKAAAAGHAHAFSNDDDRRNCVFVPRKSKQAQRAMRMAGYDFANKAPEVGDVAVRCHRDAGNKAKKLEERRGEEDYNARQDRKRCPTCQAFQSYKEHQEKRKKCQNCSVEYQGGLTWGECGSSFLGRMSRGHAKLAKAKEDKATAVLAAQTRSKVPKSLYQKALEERLAQKEAEAAANTATGSSSSSSSSGNGALASSASADSAFLRRMDEDLSRRARRLSVLEVQQQGGVGAAAMAAAAAASSSSGSAADAKAAAIAAARAAWSAACLAPASGARAAPPHARAARSGGGGGGGGLSANALAPPPMPPPPPCNAPASHTAAWQRFQRLSSHVFPRAHGPDDPLSVDELRVRVAEASLSIRAASHRLCKDEIDRLLHRADRDGSGAIRKAAYEAEVRAAYGPATWAEEGGAFKPEGAAAAAAYKEQLRLNRRRDSGTIGGQASAAAAAASSSSVGGGSASCPTGSFRLQLVYVKRHGRPAVVPASAWGGAVIGSGTTIGELRSRLWESRALFGFPCDKIVALHADAHASSRLHDSIGLGSSLLQRHAGTTVVFLLERE